MRTVSWQAGAGFGISLLCLYLAFRGIAFDQIGQALSQLNGMLFLGVYGLLALSYAVYTWRWQALLRPLAPLPFSQVWTALMLGLFCNNLLPARLGEVVRVYFLGNQTQLSKSALLATVLIERLGDVLMLLLLLTGVLWWYPFPVWAEVIGAGTATLLLGLLGFLALLAAAREQVVGYLQQPVGPLKWLSEGLRQRLQEFILTFTVPLQFLRQPRYLLPLLGFSALIWLLNVVLTQLFLLSFHILVPWYATVFLVGVSQLGTLIPASPGYVGTYQVLWQLALGVFAVTKSQALAASLVFHASWYIPLTLVGFILVLKMGLSLRQLSTLSQHSNSPEMGIPGESEQS